MLIYRTATRIESPRRVLGDIIRAANDDRQPDHDAWVALLIEAGEIESALADIDQTEKEELSALAGPMRRLVRLLAHVVVRSWDRNHAGLRGLMLSVAHAAREADALSMPDAVVVSVPEGYAYYGLYPETYVAAARKFADTVRPERCAVVGIRSIGTSLSALVAAALAESGCAVCSWTVRPRGHPFAREITFGQRLSDAVRACSNDWVAVVDEGPGLSGSSFTSVADALEDLGIPSSRIVFFPSWDPAPDQLLNERAGDRWRRHRRFLGSFDDLWIGSGRLTELLGSGSLRDLSAGRWRDVLCEGDGCRPAVQPQHEQRKFLWQPSNDGQPLLLKFVGLGRYGRRRLTRAEQLHRDGWGTEAVSLSHGFLATPWLAGRPVEAGGDDLVTWTASYAAYLGTQHADADVPVDSLLAMIRTNAAESLGDTAARDIGWVEAVADTARRASISAIDGRLLPHEWVRTSGGVVKTDALSHHDDHFLPGPQNIAWDIAGAVVELGLDAEAGHALVSAYVAQSGDAELPARLPFYRVAYLAFRVGYTTTAVQALGDNPDAAGMEQLRVRYTDLLAAELGRGGEAAA